MSIFVTFVFVAFVFETFLFVFETLVFVTFVFVTLSPVVASDSNGMQCSELRYRVKIIQFKGSMMKTSLSLELKC